MNICNQITELTCKTCIFVLTKGKSFNCCISSQKLEWNKPVFSQAFCGDGLWIIVSNLGEIALVDRVEAIKIFLKFSLAEYLDGEGVLDESEVVSFSDRNYPEYNNGYQVNGSLLGEIEYAVESKLVDIHSKLDSLLNLVNLIHDVSEKNKNEVYSREC